MEHARGRAILDVAHFGDNAIKGQAWPFDLEGCARLWNDGAWVVGSLAVKVGSKVVVDHIFTEQHAILAGEALFLLLIHQPDIEGNHVVRVVLDSIVFAR